VKGKTKTLGVRGKRRAHLEQRLQSLYHRATLVEQELVKVDENRFYRVCIFGSARIKPGGPNYQKAFELSRILAGDGIDILTGGGPGLMEAANRGALLGREEKKSKSRSIGLSIELPWEPDANNHLDVKRHHHRFSSRLDDFMRLSHAVVCTPGGIGTLLELFFVWQLVQVQHVTMRPIILMDKEFWSGMMEWAKEFPLTRGLISEKDFKCIEIVDTPEEAIEIIREDVKKFRKDNKKT
jgi:uncharacterized protein (TIGR00730 family)